MKDCGISKLLIHLVLHEVKMQGKLQPVLWTTGHIGPFDFAKGSEAPILAERGSRL